MSVFSDCLTNIKDCRNITSAQIAQMCNKNAKEVYGWMIGKHLPENWSQIECMVEALQLSEAEGEQLKSAYEQTVIGEKNYICHRKVIEFFQALQEGRDEYVSIQEEKPARMRDVELPEFAKLNNKMEILRWIQHVLDSLYGQEEKTLYLKLQTMQPEVLMSLKMFCSCVKACRMEAIVYMLKDEADAEVHNLEVLKGIAEILVQRNSVEIFCMEEVNWEKGFSDNWILSENFILWFDDELSGGMVTTNQEWVKFFLDSFEESKKSGKSIGRKAHELESLIYFFEQKSEGSSIEYMPCMGSGLTKEILDRQIYTDVPNREALIQQVVAYYEEFMQLENANWHSFFFREGLLEFMETGRIDNIPYMIYEEADFATRCEVLRNIIAVSESGKLTHYMIKDGKLPVLRNLYVEQAKDDTQKMIVDLHFQEGDKERCMMLDNGFGKQFCEFFEYLKVGGYVYSAEETVAYMKEVLEEYLGKH